MSEIPAYLPWPLCSVVIISMIAGNIEMEIYKAVNGWWRRQLVSVACFFVTSLIVHAIASHWRLWP